MSSPQWNDEIALIQKWCNPHWPAHSQAHARSPLPPLFADPLLPRHLSRTTAYVVPGTLFLRVTRQIVLPYTLYLVE